jgi:hypothetical protein
MLNAATRALPIAVALLAAGLGLAAPPLPAADCNQNGVEDHDDIASGSAPDCNANGIPDPCDIAPVNFGLVSKGSHPLGGETTAATAAADLDGDGDLDLAAALHSNRVRILWNNGRGTFTAMSNYPARIEVPALRTGAIDGNGRIDLVAAARSEITILFNRRFRRFSPVAIDLGGDAQLQALVLADLDAGGDLDIAGVASPGVIILANGGGGEFTSAPRTIPMGSNPVAIASGDFDGDGVLDLVTANAVFTPFPSGSVSILLSKGDGTFQPPRNFAAGAGPFSIAAGDLDGDGKTDVVTANGTDGDLSLLLGRGDGTLGAQRRMDVAGTPVFVGLCDVDQDGDLDLAWTREFMGILHVALNRGDAIFTKPIEHSALSLRGAFSLGDLTGDGRVDFVVVDGSWDILLLEGTLVAHDTDCDSSSVPDGCEISANDCNGNRVLDSCDVASGESLDCNQDAVPDECEADCNRNGVADDCDVSSSSEDCNRNGIPDECDVLPGEIEFDGSFLWGQVSAFGSMAARDMDADGRLDLVVLEVPGNADILWNAGNLDFAQVTSVTRDLPGPLAAPGDIDGDGSLDLVLASLALPALIPVIQSGPRTFTEAPSHLLEEGVASLCAADLDGDGRAEAAAIGLSGDLHVSPGREDGTLGPARRSPVNLGPGTLAPADIDRDGAVDLACVLRDGTPVVLWNDGTASFIGPAALTAVQVVFPTIVTLDLDGDGDLDVAVSNAERFAVFIQAGLRRFEHGAEVASNDLPALAAADLDRDGFEDLAAAHGGLSVRGIDLHRSRGDGTFDTPSRILPDVGFSSLAAADLDADGRIDLAAGLRNSAPLLALLLRNDTVAASSLDLDRNGRPDECDPGAFRRGDSDGDGALSIADAVFTLRALFQGGPEPGCAEAADADNDGAVGLSDPVSVLEFLFRGGPPPAAPGPPPGPCGLDTDPPGSPAGLGCALYASC